MMSEDAGKVENAENIEEQTVIDEYPVAKARSVRFTCGAPRSPHLFGDGSRMLFLRSAGPEDTETALWLGMYAPNDPAEPIFENFVLDGGTEAANQSCEIELVDPAELMSSPANEDVPEAERARRERARESATGIVSYSVDTDGSHIAFTVNGELFVTTIEWDSLACTFDDPLAGENGEDIRASVKSGVTTKHIVPKFTNPAHSEFAGPVLNPRISPDGTRVAYATGSAVVVVDIETCEANAIFTVSADDRATMQAGLAEFAASEELDRYDGFWWSPDSRTLLVECFDSSPEPVWTISDPANPDHAGFQHRYPRALTENAVVDLFAVRLGDDGLDVANTAMIDWDNVAYEYLASVTWEGDAQGANPILYVLDRLQHNEQILRVALPAEDEWSTLHAMDGNAMALLPVEVLQTGHNDQWIDVIAGAPAVTPSGKLIGFVNDMEHDTNRLTVDGKAFTPLGWQVHEVLDANDANVLCVVQRTPEVVGENSLPEAWQGADARYHDARSFDVVTIDYDGTVQAVSRKPGVWTAARRGNEMVVWGRTMDSAFAQMTLFSGDESYVVSNYAGTPGFTPNIRFTRLGERGLYTAIVAPQAGSAFADAKKLPVMMQPYGGPGFQRVTLSVAGYWDAQWWADQGYLVVISDGRGTTGRGPAWDRTMYLNMKDVSLQDQVDAVHALPDAIAALNAAGTQVEGTEFSEAQDAALALPEPDLDHVAMIGWSYGGFLSALAVLDAPDTFAAACAGAPPTDWTLYDTCYTERFLGLDPEVYRRNSIIDDAPKLTRPLMLIHGFADDNVTIAHSLRLSQALMQAGRAHTFLPLTGITHMTNDPKVAKNLLILQRDFLAQALSETTAE